MGMRVWITPSCSARMCVFCLIAAYSASTWGAIRPLLISPKRVRRRTRDCAIHDCPFQPYSVSSARYAAYMAQGQLRRIGSQFQWREDTSAHASVSVVLLHLRGSTMAIGMTVT